VASRFGQIKKIGSSLDHVTQNVNDLERRVQRYSKLPERAKDMIMGRVARKLVRYIRNMLWQNYNASGIQTRTGTLLKASVLDVIIEPDSRGFKIQMSPSVSYPVRGVHISKNRATKEVVKELALGAHKDSFRKSRKKGNVYAAAAIMRYGGVRQPLIHAAKSAIFDPISKTWRKRKKAAGRFGEEKKNTLKKSFAKAFAKSGDSDMGAGISYIPPKPPFFTLTPSQRSELMNIQSELVRNEMNIQFGAK
jgi:hypothetical protein